MLLRRSDAFGLSPDDLALNWRSDESFYNEEWLVYRVSTPKEKLCNIYLRVTNEKKVAVSNWS